METRTKTRRNPRRIRKSSSCCTPPSTSATVCHRQSRRTRWLCRTRNWVGASWFGGGGSGFGSGRRSWPNAGKRENEEMKSVCTRRECGVRKFVGSLARAGRESRGGGGLTRGTGNPGKRCRRGRWRKASCARVVVTDVPRVVLCGTRVERRSGRSVVSVKTTNPVGAQNTGTP